MTRKILFIAAFLLFLVPAIVFTGSNGYNKAGEIRTQDNSGLTSKDQHQNSLRWSIELPNNFVVTIKLGSTPKTPNQSAKRISK